MKESKVLLVECVPDRGRSAVAGQVVRWPRDGPDAGGSWLSPTWLRRGEGRWVAAVCRSMVGVALVAASEAVNEAPHPPTRGLCWLAALDVVAALWLLLAAAYEPEAAASGCTGLLCWPRQAFRVRTVGLPSPALATALGTLACVRVAALSVLLAAVRARAWLSRRTPRTFLVRSHDARLAALLPGFFGGGRAINRSVAAADLGELRRQLATSLMGVQAEAHSGVPRWVPRYLTVWVPSSSGGGGGGGTGGGAAAEEGLPSSSSSSSSMRPLTSVEALPSEVELRLGMRAEVRAALRRDRSAPQLLARWLALVLGLGCVASGVWAAAQPEIPRGLVRGSAGGASPWWAVLCLQAAVTSLAEGGVLLGGAVWGGAGRQGGVVAGLAGWDALSSAVAWLAATQCSGGGGGGGGGGLGSGSGSVATVAEAVHGADFLCFVDGTPIRHELGWASSADGGGGGGGMNSSGGGGGGTAGSGLAWDAMHSDAAGLSVLRGLALLLLLALLAGGDSQSRHQQRWYLRASLGVLLTLAGLGIKVLQWLSRGQPVRRAGVGGGGGGLSSAEVGLVGAGMLLGGLELGLLLLGRRRARVLGRLAEALRAAREAELARTKSQALIEMERQQKMAAMQGPGGGGAAPTAATLSKHVARTREMLVDAEQAAAAGGDGMARTAESHLAWARLADGRAAHAALTAAAALRALDEKRPPPQNPPRYLSDDGGGGGGGGVPAKRPSKPKKKLGVGGLRRVVRALRQLTASRAPPAAPAVLYRPGHVMAGPGGVAFVVHAKSRAHHVWRKQRPPPPADGGGGPAWRRGLRRVVAWFGARCVVCGYPLCKGFAVGRALVLVQRGDHLYRRQAWGAARAQYEVALATLSGTRRLRREHAALISRLHNAVGCTYLTGKPDERRAQRAFERAIEAVADVRAHAAAAAAEGGSEPVVNMNHDALFNLGSQLQRRGDLEDAVPLLQDAVVAHPPSTKARTNLAVAAIAQGQLEQARRQLCALLREHVATQDPAFFEARLQLALLDLHDLGAHDEPTRRRSKRLRQLSKRRQGQLLKMPEPEPEPEAGAQPVAANSTRAYLDLKAQREAAEWEPEPEPEPQRKHALATLIMEQAMRSEALNSRQARTDRFELAVLSEMELCLGPLQQLGVGGADDDPEVAHLGACVLHARAVRCFVPNQPSNNVSRAHMRSVLLETERGDLPAAADGRTVEQQSQSPTPVAAEGARLPTGLLPPLQPVAGGTLAATPKGQQQWGQVMRVTILGVCRAVTAVENGGGGGGGEGGGSSPYLELGATAAAAAAAAATGATEDGGPVALVSMPEADRPQALRPVVADDERATQKKLMEVDRVCELQRQGRMLSTAEVQRGARQHALGSREQAIVRGLRAQRRDQAAAAAAAAAAAQGETGADTAPAKLEKRSGVDHEGVQDEVKREEEARAPLAEKAEKNGHSWHYQLEVVTEHRDAGSAAGEREGTRLVMPVTRELSRSVEDWKLLLFDISQVIPSGPDMKLTKDWLRQCQSYIQADGGRPDSSARQPQAVSATVERKHRALESFLVKFPGLLPAARPIILRFLTPTPATSSAKTRAAAPSPTSSPAGLEAALSSALAPDNDAPSAKPGLFSKALNWVERKTGLDLDGDGDVGIVGTPKRPVPKFLSEIWKSYAEAGKACDVAIPLLEQAVALYRKALELQPTHVPVDGVGHQMMVPFARGIARTAPQLPGSAPSGQAAEASQQPSRLDGVVHTAIVTHSHHTRQREQAFARLGLGLALSSLGRHREAEQELTRALGCFRLPKPALDEAEWERQLLRDEQKQRRQAKEEASASREGGVVDRLTAKAKALHQAAVSDASSAAEPEPSGDERPESPPPPPSARRLPKKACARCGDLNEATREFCVYCGTPFPSTAAQLEAEAARRREARLAALPELPRVYAIRCLAILGTPSHWTHQPTGWQQRCADYAAQLVALEPGDAYRDTLGLLEHWHARNRRPALAEGYGARFLESQRRLEVEPPWGQGPDPMLCARELYLPLRLAPPLSAAARRRKALDRKLASLESELEALRQAELLQRARRAGVSEEQLREAQRGHSVGGGAKEAIVQMTVSMLQARPEFADDLEDWESQARQQPADWAQRAARTSALGLEEPEAQPAPGLCSDDESASEGGSDGDGADVGGGAATAAADSEAEEPGAIERALQRSGVAAADPSKQPPILDYFEVRRKSRSRYAPALTGAEQQLLGRGPPTLESSLAKVRAKLRGRGAQQQGSSHGPGPGPGPEQADDEIAARARQLSAAMQAAESEVNEEHPWVTSDDFQTVLRKYGISLAPSELSLITGAFAYPRPHRTDGIAESADAHMESDRVLWQSFLEAVLAEPEPEPEPEPTPESTPEPPPPGRVQEARAESENGVRRTSEPPTGDKKRVAFARPASAAAGAAAWASRQRGDSGGGGGGGSRHRGVHSPNRRPMSAGARVLQAAQPRLQGVDNEPLRTIPRKGAVVRRKERVRSAVASATRSPTMIQGAAGLVDEPPPQLGTQVPRLGRRVQAW
jgi:tetratricopeptide (TPR) repeat protein